MRKYKFTVVTKDDSTLQKTKTTVYENITEYSFPANGAYFFLSSKPELSKDTPGFAKTDGTWIPADKIINISMESNIHFDTLKARKAFYDQYVK